ncbi:MAG: PD-(D/E)XK nuclease family transposase [Clostridia bacterium]|nr:PD-(D/E)XK nuclease family transposase [Clostridia bacterium]
MNRKFISNSNYVLRKVLNNEEHLDILKDFIEAILDINIQEIELNQYLEEKEKYLPKEENFGIADVRIRTNENEEINIGIQFIDGIYIQTKMLMYYAQIHLNQLEHEPKREFAKTITINLLDFKYFSSKEYYKTIKIKSNENNIQFKELELYVIELPKLIIEDEENMTKKEEWISYLKGSENKILEKIKNNNPDIKKLDELAEKYWMEEKME